MKKFLFAAIGFTVLFLVVGACATMDSTGTIFGGLTAVGAMAFTPKFNKIKMGGPQNKLVSVANRLGNPGLKNNQGSTFEVWDYIEIATTSGPNILEFFVNPQSKNFPFTNMADNKLSVGEGMVIERLALTYLVVKDSDGMIMGVDAAANALDSFALAEIEILQDNQRVLKANSTMFSNTFFNVNGNTGTNYIMTFDTLITIQPQIPFTVRVKYAAQTVTPGDGNSAYIGCHLQGTGAILNTKANF